VSGPGRTRYRADVVLTADEAGAVHRPGALDVDADGRVAWVGPLAEAPAPDGDVVDLGGLIMPGLVNAHGHTPMTLVRSAGDGLPLDRWLTEGVWPREGRMTAEDVWWGMVLGSLEMLRAGVTTSCEMYLFEEAVIDAVEHTGARLVMTPGVVSALHADTFGSSSDRVAAIADVHARHHDPGGRITVGVAPHSLYDLGIGMVVELAESARSLGAPLHLHLEETQRERVEVLDRFGRPAVLLLAERGVFEGAVLAAHCVWVDDTEADALADHGVAIAHCPQSNMKLGSGIAPVAGYRRRGITVALGTDGPASNDDLDLWEEMKLAPLLARVGGDPAAMSPRDALAMATREGGRALGLPDVGHLSPGAWADFQRIDLDQPAFVPLTGPEDLLAHLVFAGSSRYVTDVWVAGRLVVSAGECTTVDRHEAQAQVRRRALRLAG
jgi:5-methylthioadenosine/S-adenosylhomocysteine deaminase